SIASKSRAAPADWPKRGRFFADYGSALRESGADLVYVSLPNALHEPWIFEALAAGRHVIVDNPALTTRQACERAVGEARRAGLFLPKPTVSAYQPHRQRLHAFAADRGPPTRAAPKFVIPPLPIDNFRNHAGLGGGCLLDMGSYAAALIRTLGGGLKPPLAA